jgi:hypothetical protein
MGIEIEIGIAFEIDIEATWDLDTGNRKREIEWDRMAAMLRRGHCIKGIYASHATGRTGPCDFDPDETNPIKCTFFTPLIFHIFLYLCRCANKRNSFFRV